MSYIHFIVFGLRLNGFYDYWDAWNVDNGTDLSLGCGQGDAVVPTICEPLKRFGLAKVGKRHCLVHLTPTQYDITRNSHPTTIQTNLQTLLTPLHKELFVLLFFLWFWRIFVVGVGVDLLFLAF